MEKQSHNEDDEPAPPYEENDHTPILSEKPAQMSSSLPTALERVSEVRQQRLKLLVDGHIEPLLEGGILHGKPSQTVLILPSGSIPLPTILTASNLVHRPKSASTNIVQLQGPTGTADFWTQPRVVEDLDRAIQRTLQNLTGVSPPPQQSLPPRPADLSSPITGQKSWLKRTFGLPGPDHDPTGSTGQWRLGWRSEDADSREKALSPDEFALSVKVREVAFRTETEMGLLTTTTAKCIVVEMECGT